MNLDNVFSEVKQASKELASLSDEQRNEILLAVSAKISSVRSMKMILDANLKDLEKMPKDSPKLDRLKLNKSRIKDIANGFIDVSKLPSPIGRILRETTHPNGMKITKKSVPFGVIGIIYEARPNVTLDVFALCFKSGNACVLKGGSDAANTNEVIVGLIHKVLESKKINPHVVELLPSEHEAATALMNARGYVDLIIPRGGSGLINYVRENSKVPIIETGAGICHTYFDLYGFTSDGAEIIRNAKTRRVSVCNALDCLLIHSARLNDLPELCHSLCYGKTKVTIYADERALQALKGTYDDNYLLPATEESFGTEFLDYKMAIKTVDSIEEAIAHISRYGSRHSESIITEHTVMAKKFCEEIDAACVYVNTPTSFTDGAQFGLGAEIGISTQKLHARGPMGLEEMTTYKWIIEGDGQIRE